MKVSQIVDENGQHIIAIENGDEMRCFFKSSSIHTAGAALSSLRRDIASHGEDVIDVSKLAKIASRITKAGNTAYMVVE